MQIYGRKFQKKLNHHVKSKQHNYPSVSDFAIGAAIRKLRRDLGLTQKHLASRLDITRQQVQHYECGKNKLTVEQIQRISKALDVPVSHFFPQSSSSLEPLPLSRLTSTEQMFLRCFRQAREGAVKDIVLRLIILMAGDVQYE